MTASKRNVCVIDNTLGLSHIKIIVCIFSFLGDVMKMNCDDFGTSELMLEL